MPFITKKLSKEIMKRLRLRKKFLRNKTDKTFKLYVKQRSKCVSLLKKGKKEYYQSLDEENVIHNKQVSTQIENKTD